LYEGFLKKDQKRVLQYFLFSCYTGIRYTDLKNLKNSNIYFENENPIISLKQIKTNKPIEIPLANKAQKYLPEKGQPDLPVFKYNIGLTVYCAQNLTFL